MAFLSSGLLPISAQTDDRVNVCPAARWIQVRCRGGGSVVLRGTGQATQDLRLPGNQHGMQHAACSQTRPASHMLHATWSKPWSVVRARAQEIGCRMPHASCYELRPPRVNGRLCPPPQHIQLPFLRAHTSTATILTLVDAASSGGDIMTAGIAYFETNLVPKVGGERSLKHALLQGATAL